MKIKLWLFIVIVSYITTLKAQFPNPINFYSATNASNTGTLSIGTNDLHWFAALTNSIGPYVPAVSCGYAYGGWAPTSFTNANWISYPHTCVANSPAEHSCLNPASLDIFYKLVLTLPSTNCGQPVSTSSVYCLTLNMYADNSIYEVFVNGVSNYLNPSSNPYFDMGYSPNANKVITLCNNWQPGSNSVLVHVKSGAGPLPTWEALLVTAAQTINTFSTQPNISVSPGPAILCAGIPVSYTASGASTYSWQPGNLSGSTITVTPLTTTNYTVMGSNTSGCRGTAYFTQSVAICEGISEIDVASIKIYPNPTHGEFEVLNIESNAHVEVLNGLGELICEFNFNGDKKISNLASEPKGIYFVKISTLRSTIIKRVIRE